MFKTPRLYTGRGYMGYLGVCDPNGYFYLVVLVRNGFSVLSLEPFHPVHFVEVKRKNSKIHKFSTVVIKHSFERFFKFIWKERKFYQFPVVSKQI